MLYSSLSNSHYSITKALNESVLVENLFINPIIVPIAENAELGRYEIPFTFIQPIAEDAGVGYNDLFYLVCESHGLNPDDCVVSIADYSLIENPGLANVFEQYIVQEISDNSIAYQFCEGAFDLFLETGDEEYLSCISEGIGSWVGNKIAKFDDMKKSSKLYQMYKKGPIQGYLDHRSHMSKKAHEAELASQAEKIGALGKLSSDQAEKISKQEQQIAALQSQVDNASKSWLSKKIAALRKIYATWLQKAKESSDSGKANIFKRIAAKIMGVIDIMLKKLQDFTE